MHITELNIRKQAQKHGTLNILRVFEKFYLRGVVDDETFEYAHTILRSTYYQMKRVNSVQSPTS